MSHECKKAALLNRLTGKVRGLERDLTAAIAADREDTRANRRAIAELAVEIGRLGAELMEQLQLVRADIAALAARVTEES